MIDKKKLLKEMIDSRNWRFKTNTVAEKLGVNPVTLWRHLNKRLSEGTIKVEVKNIAESEARGKENE